MEHFSKWVVGSIVGLFGVLGLFLSANAHDQTFYGMGLAVFVLAVFVIFFLMRRAFDENETHAGSTRH